MLHSCWKIIDCPICKSCVQKSYRIVLTFTINEKHWNSPIEQSMQEFLRCSFLVKQWQQNNLLEYKDNWMPQMEKCFHRTSIFPHPIPICSPSKHTTDHLVLKKYTRSFYGKIIPSMACNLSLYTGLALTMKDVCSFNIPNSKHIE